MRIYISFILSIICLQTFAQKEDNKLVFGTVDTVFSKILNEKRVVYIHVPNGDKRQRYPVLYVLDGESHFQSAVAIVEQMSRIIPNMVIVGITNTNRDRDLTPTHVKPDRMVSPGEASQSGGGENFISFIEKELIPYVDAHYPTRPYRVLSGHSYGGLTVINAFINHTGLFNAYIAIDPSLWWEGGQWIKKYEGELARRSFSNKALFVAIANNLPPGMDTISVLKDTSIDYLFTRSELNFVHSLRNRHTAGITAGHEILSRRIPWFG